MEVGWRQERITDLIVARTLKNRLRKECQNYTREKTRRAVLIKNHEGDWWIVLGKLVVFSNISVV